MSTIGDFSPEAYELLREYYGERLTSVRDQDFHEVAVLGEMETETLTLTAKYLTDPENFSEEELWEFARCQRPDGSFYGTRGTCRKGKPVSADAKDEDMERVKKEEKAAKEKRKDARKKMSGMKPSLREIAKAMDEDEEGVDKPKKAIEAKRRTKKKSEEAPKPMSQDKKQSEKGRKPKKTKTPAIKDEDVEAALMEMDRDGDISDKTFEKLRKGGRSMTEILEAIENYGIPSKKRGKSNGRKSGK